LRVRRRLFAAFHVNDAPRADPLPRDLDFGRSPAPPSSTVPGPLHVLSLHKTDQYDLVENLINGWGLQLSGTGNDTEDET